MGSKPNRIYSGKIFRLIKRRYNTEGTKPGLIKNRIVCSPAKRSG